MKKRFIFLVIIGFSLSLFSCSDKKTEEGEKKEIVEVGSEESNKMAPKYMTMDQSEAHEKMQKDSSVVVVDVRTEQEYAKGHIPGAILISDFEIEEKAEDLLQDKNVTILVYCRSGNRSKSATMALNVLGYTKVYDIGGLLDWEYEIVK